jgi:hypothetical protein
MRPSRKRKLLLWALVALLLLVIAGSIEYRYRFCSATNWMMIARQSG